MWTPPGLDIPPSAPPGCAHSSGTPVICSDAGRRFWVQHTQSGGP